MYQIIVVILLLYYNVNNFQAKPHCTDIMYLYLTCSTSFGVNQYLDIWNGNKFNSIQFNSTEPNSGRSVRSTVRILSELTVCAWFSVVVYFATLP
jgi:hypothetical protein